MEMSCRLFLWLFGASRVGAVLGSNFFFLVQFVGAVGRLDVGFDISLQRFRLTLFFSCARLLEFSLMIPAVALEGAV